MKKFLIVTYIPFWKGGAGHASRLCAIITYLKDKVDLTVLFVGQYFGDDEMRCQHFEGIKIHFLHGPGNSDLATSIKKFGVYMSDNSFDIVLLEYIEMYYLLGYIPRQTIKILDTHDIISEKIKSFEKYDVPFNGMRLDIDTEIAMFEAFDYVVLINKVDYQRILKKMPRKQLLLIPHPVSFVKREIRPKVSVISFIASEYAPNIDAIEYFLKEVWPSFTECDLSLNIYGRITTKIAERDFESKRIKLIGFTDNLEDVYAKSDIIINPVRAGAGLKIKNIEALGNGLPLVTTSHGISGIEDARSALVVADSPSEFIYALRGLIEDFSLRKTLSRNASAYVQKNFSTETCFRPFLSFL